MTFFSIILFCAVIISIVLLISLSKLGIKKITLKVNLTTNKLGKLIESKPQIGLENYCSWLNHKPEKLWTRILTHSAGNNKKRAELSRKIWMVCDSIERVIKRDQTVGSLLKIGGIDFDTIDEMKREREQLIGIIEQGFYDIEKELN